MIDAMITPEEFKTQLVKTGHAETERKGSRNCAWLVAGLLGCVSNKRRDRHKKHKKHENGCPPHFLFVLFVFFRANLVARSQA
jgi:hypothetical protein